MIAADEYDLAEFDVRCTSTQCAGTDYLRALCDAVEPLVFCGGCSEKITDILPVS